MEQGNNLFETKEEEMEFIQNLGEKFNVSTDLTDDLKGQRHLGKFFDML